jgi:predicted DNA-binding transcriptional regulator AlpA
MESAQMNTQTATPRQRQPTFAFSPPLQGTASIGAVRRQLFGLSTSAFYRLRRDNADTFPHQIDFGPHRRGMFDVQEVLDWLAARKKANGSIKPQAKPTRRVRKSAKQEHDDISAEAITKRIGVPPRFTKN